MSDINWDDNAKAAVKEFAAWAKLVDNGLIGVFMEHVISRPQQKTVADAYEYYNGVWPDDQDNYIYYFCVEGKFNSRNCDWEDSERSYKVCTREQFEAYAKEQEAKQEGEKWTHTYENIKCRIVLPNKDKFGTIIVFSETGEYFTPRESDLKPIKPTLTKAEAWNRCMEEFGVRNIKYVMQELMDEFDIT